MAAPDPLQQNMYEHSLASVVNTATIGSTSNAAGQSRIQVTYSFVQTQVVGAQLSSDRALLVLVTLIRAADGREEEWGAYFRFHVVSCRDWTVTLPVIDVLDISGGGLAAPTFSIRYLSDVPSLECVSFAQRFQLKVSGCTDQQCRHLDLNTCSQHWGWMLWAYIA